MKNWEKFFRKWMRSWKKALQKKKLHAFMHVIDKVYYNMGKMKGENS